jgi:hypothetical protein
MSQVISMKKRTLLYLASGDYHPDYESLPYDKVILVDRNANRYEGSIPQNSKVAYWQMDALESVDVIAAQNLQIDCIVSVNEGLWEGGGTYPIFSEFLLGYLSSYLADYLLVVTNLDYYGPAGIKTRVAKMDWGFHKVKRLFETDVDYINPGLFSIERRILGRHKHTDYGHVYLLCRTKTVLRGEMGSIKLSVHHGSIWEDQHQLDCIGLSFPSDGIPQNRSLSSRQVEFFHNREKVLPISGMTMSDILAYCQEKGIRRIGLTPWMNGNYSNALDELKNYKGKELEVHLYHLNARDFVLFRLNLVDYFLQTYPELFRELHDRPLYMDEFAELLTRGYGKLIDAVCREMQKEYHKSKGEKRPYFKQIKLKFGRLRIYIGDSSPRIRELVEALEHIAL